MPLNLHFYVSNTQPPGHAITAPVLQALRPRPALVRPASSVIVSFVFPLPDPLLDRLITFVLSGTLFSWGRISIAPGQSDR